MTFMFIKKVWLRSSLIIYNIIIYYHFKNFVCKLKIDEEENNASKNDAQYDTTSPPIN